MYSGKDIYTCSMLIKSYALLHIMTKVLIGHLYNNMLKTCA